MSKKEIGQAAAVLAIAAISSVVASWLSKKPVTVVQVPAIATSTAEAYVPVTCALDTQSFEQTKANKDVVLLSNFMSSVSNENVLLKNVVLKRTGLQSQIACGYIFYRLSVKGRAFQSQYEDLYMAPTDSKQFGGHIIPTDKNTISTKVVDGKMEVLLPLNAVPYDGKERVVIKQVDWVSLLNVSSEMSFQIFLNTMDDRGQIDDLEIAYKCWNPQTGHETDDCKLEVE
jgi:hypothetical protein